MSNEEIAAYLLIAAIAVAILWLTLTERAYRKTLTPEQLKDYLDPNKDPQW